MTNRNHKREPILAQIGDTGLDRAAGQINEEWHKKLRNDQWRDVYREMKDNEAGLGAARLVIEMLARQAPIIVKPNESGAEGAEEEADRIKESLYDMETPLQLILSEILTAIDFGWLDLEPTYKIRAGEQTEPRLNSQYTDRRFGWRDWGTRSQESHDRWVFSDEGRVMGWIQRPPHDYVDRFLPVDRLLRFRFRGSKGNPEGRSFYRSAYTSYAYAKRLREVEGIAAERDGAGLPIMQVPPEIMHPNATADQKAIRTSYENFVKKARMDTIGGAVIAAETGADGKSTGYKFELLSASGRSKTDIDPIIRRYERAMLTVFMAEFIDLGQQTGSWSMHSDKTTLLAMAIKALLELVAEVINKDAIPRLQRLNGKPHELDPYVEFGDIEDQSLTEAAGAIAQLISSGAMEASPDLDEWARARLGLAPQPERPLMDMLETPQPMQAQPLPEVEPEQPIELADEPEPEPEDPPVMDVDEAADFLRVPRSTLMRAIRNGKLPGAKFGNNYRLRREDLVAFMSMPEQGALL